MTTTLPSFDIAIHGAGFVGRTLALLLAQAGFKIALIDSQVPSGNVDIRAFSFNPSSKALLERLGAWPADAHATPVLSIDVFGDAGGATHFSQTEPLSWIVDVPALSDLLQSLSAAEPRITVLKNGDALQAKLDVACEGNASARLSQIGLQPNAIRYQQHAIAARLSCDGPHGNKALQWFNERGEVLALLPMQGHEVALVWSLAADRAKAMQSASEAEFAAALLTASNSALGSMQLTSQRALWPLQLIRIDNWVGEQNGKTWVLAGDAAHTVHPLAGQGLNLGLGDVALLAKTLQSFLLTSPFFNPSAAALRRALNQYARARQAAAEQMSGVTDGLHLLFAHQNPLVKQARNIGMKLFDGANILKRIAIGKAQ